MRFPLPLSLLVAFVAACSASSSSPSASTGKNDPAPDDTADPEDPSSTATTSSGSAARRDGAALPAVIETDESMLFGGLKRTYILAKPSNYTPTKAYPLVFVFHGNPGKASDMRASNPFDAASHDQAVIVYPQGLGHNWDLYNPFATNNDMPWIQALATEIATKVNIDRARVFGHGFSGGAFFVAQMACRLGAFFEAISVHAGGGPEETQVAVPRWPNGCVQCAGGPTPTLVVHGASDTTVVPQSGAYTASCYATTNGCGTKLTATTAPCEAYDCPTSSPVELCMVPSLGHQIWSAATDKAWRFFQRF
jgi:polyhydroxybutyrate depolymerase